MEEDTTCKPRHSEIIIHWSKERVCNHWPNNRAPLIWVSKFKKKKMKNVLCNNGNPCKWASKKLKDKVFQILMEGVFMNLNKWKNQRRKTTIQSKMKYCLFQSISKSIVRYCIWLRIFSHCCSLWLFLPLWTFSYSFSPCVEA